MNEILLRLKVFFAAFLLILIGSCSSGGGGGDEDADIFSEIDEATDDISNSEEDGDSDYAEESGAEDDENSDFAQDNGEEGEQFDQEEFSEEEFETADGEEEFADEDNEEEIAQSDDENFEDFEELGDGEVGEEGEASRELAQNEEPILEGLDEESANAFNEPPENPMASTSEPEYPEATIEESNDKVASASIDYGSESETFESEESGNSTQSWIPVKKIKTEPFYRNGRLLNTVYIVRKETKLSKISQKIFGKDKSSILLEDNPHLARGAKTGDKVYYNSPLRSNDSSTMKIAYEDVGAAAEEYVTRAGDNIRRFSERLLGFQDAWKEVWATNANVQSKNEVDQGLVLQYWRDDLGSLNTNLAKENQPPGLDVATAGIAEDFNSDFDSQPNQGFTPPPPPPVTTNLTSVDQQSPNPPVVGAPPIAPPEPPQAVEMMPPPPPQPEATLAEKELQTQEGSGQFIGSLGVANNTTLIYVALGLIAAVALFVKRKKSSSRAPSVFEATQV